MRVRRHKTLFGEGGVPDELAVVVLLERIDLAPDVPGDAVQVGGGVVAVGQRVVAYGRWLNQRLGMWCGARWSTGRVWS
jgi:hypothetical protein